MQKAKRDIANHRSRKAVQHAEIILKFINALPKAVSAAVVPGWRGFLKMKKDIRDQIIDIKATEYTDKWQLDISHPTIFHELMSSKVLPPQEKSIQRLAEEGQVLVQAGTLTASWTLTIATYHLLSQPKTLRRLRDELVAQIPDPNAVVPVTELEKLPFLRAVVKEALRHSLGASGRIALVCPDETLVYTDKTDERKPKTYLIPPGNPVGMTNYKTHRDPSIYPDPFAFNPDRWLTGDEEELQRLDQHFTVFSGGSRACLGIWLAQAEITLALAKLFRVWGCAGGCITAGSEIGEEKDLEKYDRRTGDVGSLRLFETTAKDVHMAADYFIPIPWKGTKGVRVVVESFF